MSSYIFIDQKKMNKTNNPCQDSANKSDSLTQIQLSTTQLKKITTFKGKKKKQPQMKKPTVNPPELKIQVDSQSRNN